jgi:RNA polymerase sigma-70 factor (ECF subfamily)
MEAQLAAPALTEAPSRGPGAVREASPERPPANEAFDDAFVQARAGDAQGFRQLLRLHQDRVFRIALRFTGDPAEAEELAQDVFVKLHGALPQIQTPAHLVHWLLRTVSHRCIDRQRHARRRPRLIPIDALPDAGNAPAPDPGGDPLANARLHRLLHDLAPDARAVVLLRYQEDQDPTEIATALGMSVNTVKSHLRRSLDWLRAQYAGDSNGY